MNNRELLEFHSALQAVANVSGKLKFSYAVMRTVEKMMPAIKALHAAHIVKEKARVILCVDHAAVDEDGNPKTYKVGGQDKYEMADEDAFNADLKDMPEALDYEALLDEAAAFDPHMVAYSEDPAKCHVPESLTAAQLLGIEPMIDDVDEEAEG